jgi:hypothetical protein
VILLEEHDCDLAVAKTKKAINPFYVLLVVAGVLFVITACAYGVMAVRLADPARAAETSRAGAGLIALMDRHGLTIMTVELIVLAIATIAAITTDGYWSRRATSSDERPQQTDHNQDEYPVSQSLPGQHGKG